MKTNRANGVIGWRQALVPILALLASLPAGAAALDDEGKFRLSWDTTVSVGASWRVEDRDTDLIGLSNGGGAYSVNGDDGDLNYGRGLYSFVPKITSEIEFSYGERWGGFLRGSTFYDFQAEESDTARTPLADAALERVGSRTELLDAYAWVRFDIGSQPAELRVGDQVISWGESTFIQGGINAINPVNVSALRIPGAELREALLPEGLVRANFALTTNTALDLFYQYRWNDTEIDPPGSYWSTSDFAGDGGSVVYLGFGSPPDVPQASQAGTPLQVFEDPTDPTRPVLGVPRALDRPPDDSGQFGAALQWFVPALNDVELGFYYMNYHSRLPLISGRTGTVAGAITAGTIAAGATPIATSALTYLAMHPGDLAGAVGAGIATGGGIGVPLGASQRIAEVAVATGGNAAAITSVATAYATDAYARTARYYLEYPEDIELYGLSFNTDLGRTGIALQGEVSYRVDAPLQVDDVELLFAALTPVNPAFGLGSPGASQLATFRGQSYATAFETDIPGYILRDVVQYQTTATKVFGPGLGADQSVLLLEVALTHVEDMPGKDELRLEGPGTYTSGNPFHAMAVPGAAHVGKAAEPGAAFADATSWGYRVVGRSDFNNAIGAVRLSPSFQWQHDVQGVSPGPGGNFIEDRRAITLGVQAGYQNNVEADLSFTRYFGASRYNLINDRDFIAASVKYSF